MVVILQADALRSILIAMNEDFLKNTLIYLRECHEAARKLRNSAVETSNQLKTVRSSLVLSEKADEILKIKKQADQRVAEIHEKALASSIEDNEIFDYQARFVEMLSRIQSEADELKQMAGEELPGEGVQ